MYIYSRGVARRGSGELCVVDRYSFYLALKPIEACADIAGECDALLIGGGKHLNQHCSHLPIIVAVFC